MTRALWKSMNRQRPQISERSENTGRRLWVNVQGLGDEALLRELAEIFTIHPLALEDVANLPVRPKSESYDLHLLIVTQIPRLGRDGQLSVGR